MTDKSRLTRKNHLNDYYTLITRAPKVGYSLAHKYDTLPELLSAFNLEDNELLAQYEQIEISHIKGKKNKIVFHWLDDNIEIFDKEVFDALEKRRLQECIKNYQ